MVQRLMGGPEFSIDCLGDLDGRCLNAIPRTMIESRGGESIKGTVDRRRRARRARAARRGGAGGRAGPCTVQAFRDREIGLGITDVNTRFGGAFPAPMYAALPGPDLPRADRADGARRDGRAARRRVHAPARPSRATSGSSSSTSEHAARPAATSSARPGPPRPR